MKINWKGVEIIDSKIIQSIIDLIKESYWYAILFLLILLALIILGVIYKHNKYTQKIINIFENVFFPYIKKNIIIFEVFTKQEANSKGVEDKYLDEGFKKITVNYKANFDDSSWINEENIQKFLDKQDERMRKIKKGSKKGDSLAYLGFPHIPIGVMDGYNFSGTNNVILYDYDGSSGNSPEKGFFELKKVYNSDIEIHSNYEGYKLSGDEIILKIEQSFKIKDSEIRRVVGDKDIIYLSNKDNRRWGIKSYSDVDRFTKEFEKILSWAKDNEVNKVHLFMTTPVSLTFALGQVITHYYPDIIIYNYNNNKFDWCVDIKRRKVNILS